MITWTREELKSRGKATVKMYYWKLVLVSLILSAITGGATSAGRNGVKNSRSASTGNVDVSGVLSGINPMAVMVASIAVLVILLLAFAIKIFALNVLVVGCKGFFSQSMTGEPEFGILGNGFTRNYWNCVKTCFLRDLFVGLWSLLFVIPGIVKSYEYRMVPYLLAEHPEMSSSEVFAQSKQMMNGNKWAAFVLDLSFIGWYILSGLTLGILAIFYVSPYVNATHAALYEALCYANPAGSNGFTQQEDSVNSPFRQENV